jgi:inositol polyphosphate 5-phosphatase INPP5B/F
MLINSRKRMRIGTFNVNGKTPSQDLTSWVRGPSSLIAQGNIIPPLKPISPLSLGDLKNPIDVVYVDPENNKTNADQIDKEKAKKTNASTSFVDDDDFDMLVLGFQELDLSAEALLISTSTAREEQWTTAVIAGLGERGVLYEKVSFLITSHSPLQHS